MPEKAAEPKVFTFNSAVEISIDIAPKAILDKDGNQKIDRATGMPKSNSAAGPVITCSRQPRRWCGHGGARTISLATSVRVRHCDPAPMTFLAWPSFSTAANVAGSFMTR
jgi:hypothetical protein